MSGIDARRIVAAVQDAQLAGIAIIGERPRYPVSLQETALANS
jgi:hypothetical protein